MFFGKLKRSYLDTDGLGFESVTVVTTDGPLDHLAGAFKDLGRAFEFPASRDAAVELGAAEGEGEDAVGSIPGSASGCSRSLVLARPENEKLAPLIFSRTLGKYE